jgi:hypothetical protein
MYEKEMQRLLAEIGAHKEELLSANGEAEFAERLEKLPSHAALLPVCYAMLHGLTPSTTPAPGASFGRGDRCALMERLLRAFTPAEEEAAEVARRLLLWETLESTCKYLSAYRSRSSANNCLGLDDVAAVAPDALRMSIHNKSKDSGAQFPIKVGANVHRTPWHGSAEVRLSRREKAMVIDTKLAGEMWDSHVAVLPSLESATMDERQAAWQRYCGHLSNAGQPLFFADVSTLPANWQQHDVLSTLPLPVKQAPAIRPDRRMKKKCDSTLGGA